MNILDPILHHCRFNSPAPALCAPGTGYKLVSYGRLERFIHNVSRKGAQLGLSAGHVVALYVVDQVLQVALMLGLARLGVVTLSAGDPNLPKELRVDALITDTTQSFATPHVLRADATWLDGDGAPLDDARIARPAADDLCGIILTSGTTGAPKAVGISHDMMVRRLGRYGFAYGARLSDYSRIYCDPALATSIGFQFLIYGLWRGGTFFLPGGPIEANVEAFERHQVQTMVVAPGSLTEFVRFYEERPSRPCSLEMIVSAGSALPGSLSDRARARLCANLVSGYGSTEAALAASAPAHLLRDVAGAAGYVLPDMTIETVDTAGRRLPSGQEGIVRISGPCTVSGYIGPAHHADSALGGGWFYPGDIGRVTADGLLVISGRERAVVNLGGVKLQPEMVEEVIRSFDGIEDAAVFGRPDELGIDRSCALVVARGPVDEAALRAFCARKIAQDFMPVRFIAVKSLPRNAMGKLERGRLLDIARAQAH